MTTLSTVDSTNTANTLSSVNTPDTLDTTSTSLTSASSGPGAGHGTEEEEHAAQKRRASPTELRPERGLPDLDASDVTMDAIGDEHQANLRGQGHGQGQGQGHGHGIGHLQGIVADDVGGALGRRISVKRMRQEGKGFKESPAPE